MAKTPSNMLPLGTVAPEFNLPDTRTGRQLKLSDLPAETGSVIMFICNHCPFVVHVKDELARLARDYQGKGVAFAAISSNDVTTHPADAPDKMAEFAKQNGFTFPYLYDESQAVAKAYDAACTPDFYLFDASKKLIYRGQLDGSRPGNSIPVTGSDLRAALDALIAGRPVNAEQYPSIGCNIKWK